MSACAVICTGNRSLCPVCRGFWPISRLREKGHNVSNVVVESACAELLKHPTLIFKNRLKIMTVWKISVANGEQLLTICAGGGANFEKHWKSTMDVSTDGYIICPKLTFAVGCYSRNYHLLSQTVDRYRTKVPKLEATWLGLLRTSKISTIDPIVAKLYSFEKRSIFSIRFRGISWRPKIWPWYTWRGLLCADSSQIFVLTFF